MSFIFTFTHSARPKWHISPPYSARQPLSVSLVGRCNVQLDLGPPCSWSDVHGTYARVRKYSPGDHLIF